MTVYIDILKGKEIFYYEDWDFKHVIIGVRGVNEFKIPIWDIVRAGDSFRINNGRIWTNEEALQWALKWAYKESQYVDFEEVPNTIKLLR